MASSSSMDVAGGTYRVTVIAAGFGPESVMMTLPAPDLALTLRPAPVVEEVSVVSVDRQEQLRQHLNTRVDVISRARIDDTGPQRWPRCCATAFLAS